MKMSVPYNGDVSFFEGLISSDLITHVAEVYFAGNPMVLGSGRRPKIGDFIVSDSGKFNFDQIRYDEEIIKLIRACTEKGISCNLLLNFDGCLTQAAVRYVSHLIDFGVSTVTVGSLDLLKQVKSQWGDQLEIQNSVYINVDSYRHIEELINSGISIFLMPTEMNHDFSKINKVHDILSKYDHVKLKIMVNEGCIKYCPHRRQDQWDAQNYKVELAIQDYVDQSEIKRVLSQPCRVHMNTKGVGKTNFIQPNDMRNYEKFNPIIKVVGRSFDTERILLTIRSYAGSMYKGDLRMIIENFKHSQSPVYSDSPGNTNFLLEGE